MGRLMRLLRAVELAVYSIEGIARSLQSIDKRLEGLALMHATDTLHFVSYEADSETRRNALILRHEIACQTLECSSIPRPA